MSIAKKRNPLFQLYFARLRMRCYKVLTFDENKTMKQAYSRL
ncbi:hypothetical protein BMETH_347_0 [methanotrophic bacterial endosymbiont of Bathymodiolus sp.]|nr:hypothetical protein BMETH_347_0 [methanotrophic bacterial endosymbiont of Bathymodiolus sp.]